MYPLARELIESRLGAPRVVTPESCRWLCRDHGTGLWVVLRDRAGHPVISLEGHDRHKSELEGIQFLEVRNLEQVRWILDRVNCVESHGTPDEELRQTA